MVNISEGKISLVERNRRLGARKRRVEYWLDDGLANGSDALSKICGTLLEDFEKLWTFTKTLGMEPTNNLAERASANWSSGVEKAMGREANAEKNLLSGSQQLLKPSEAWGECSTVRAAGN